MVVDRHALERHRSLPGAARGQEYRYANVDSDRCTSCRDGPRTDMDICTLIARMGGALLHDYYNMP